MSKKKNNKDEEKPKVNPKLEGFDVRIDSFGEIQTNINIDKINRFLDQEVEDKKLKDRKDFDSKKDSKKK